MCRQRRGGQKSKQLLERARTRCGSGDGMKLCTIRLSVSLARQSVWRAGLSRLWVTSSRRLKGSRADGDARGGASDLSWLRRVLATVPVNVKCHIVMREEHPAEERSVTDSPLTAVLTAADFGSLRQSEKGHKPVSCPCWAHAQINADDDGKASNVKKSKKQN